MSSRPSPDHGAHLPQLFKALADAHPGVALVLAGSRRHLMERLVIDGRAPLYGMAQKLALGPIPEGVMVRFLVVRAAAGGKEIDPATAGHIVEVAGPVPNDIQRLAYEAFNLAGHLASVGSSSLSPSRLTTGPSPRCSPVPSAFAGGNSVKRVIDALEADELIADEGEWRVVDPFLAAWLRPSAGGTSIR